ncbi:MAG TPA: hypothetical protein VK712_03710 [Verrucomicrobiae bacterium]|jgi:hypothetical protein|nr:hypothetical protein [Verrucomicrobiae bacterium]
MLRDRSQRDRRDLWDKIWRDRHGHVVVFQMPNIWLIAWVILTLISLLSPSHNTANLFWWLSTGVLVIWALLEVFRGVNYFRRGLGLVILLMTVGASFGIGL